MTPPQHRLALPFGTGTVTGDHGAEKHFVALG